jgi:phosphopantothenoylcysteine decarboxylase/phosphopantothenate--cysteine ligase
MYNLTGRSIILGVTGSIAVYKAVDLTSKLTQAGALVDVIMTPAATKFVSPITFQSVSGRRVYWDMGSTQRSSEPHVALARRAHLLVIAPATATMIARLALGLAEEMVSLTALSTRAPLVVCPAMDSQMFEHAATQEHLELLRKRGVKIIGPDEGRLASGQIGRGRLSEVEFIIGGIRHVLGANGDLAGKKVVVSAGGTHEPIDPVRFVGNKSSGKMGYAVAEAARDRGATVTLISGPASLADPVAAKSSVQRAAEMADVSECEDATALPPSPITSDEASAKVKRQNTVSLPLVRSDILGELGSRPPRRSAWLSHLSSAPRAPEDR